MEVLSSITRIHLQGWRAGRIFLECFDFHQLVAISNVRVHTSALRLQAKVQRSRLRSDLDESQGITSETSHPCISWPGTALHTARGIRNNNWDQIMIKYFHGYPTVEESSAFMFHSDMKGLKDSIVGNSILRGVSSQWRKIESHAVPGHGISSKTIDLHWVSGRQRLWNREWIDCIVKQLGKMERASRHLLSYTLMCAHCQAQ